MLHITKVELELISDADKCLFFEKGIRGGVYYISKRYNKANNKHFKFYDPEKKNQNIYVLKQE